MARVRMTGGRERRRTRGGALSRALVAAGEPPLLATYDLSHGSPCERFFYYTAQQANFQEMTATGWPSEADSLDAIPETPLFRDGRTAVYRLADGTLVLFSLGQGWAYARAAAGKADHATQALAALQALYPPTFLEAGVDDRIPITFWTLGKFGPEQRLRMIDTATWEAIEGNYPEDVRAALAPLMSGFDPGADGQLILWQGPPGTGKTWALRALASEWLPWAEFSYITDPDAFFVDAPSYMIDVLLHDSYSAVEETSGSVYTEAGQGKWRVLILEDTGELLSATAKERYGQGLSRLLNVVDGMIGQGLRVLCLVTTNDELGELNAAVRRPGRCAAQIVFPAFPAEEATAWLAERTEQGDWIEAQDGDRTLAELYDTLGKAEKALVAAANPDAVAAIRAVAEAYQDEAIGYGETAYNAETGTVYWIHGDWTDHDAAREAFLEIDGVNAVECEAEGIPDGWWDASVLYPEPAPKWVTTPPAKQQAVLDDLVALASRPLI